MGRIEGKVAVITGAASGIGRASAIRFTQEGAAAVLADLNEQGAREAAAECVRGGGRAVAHRTDVTSEADIQSAIARAVSEFGRLDIMFNNAGLTGVLGPIETVSATDWDKTIAVMLRAAYLGMKHAIPQMRKGGGGSIISTSSAAGLRGLGHAAAYSAAKAGIIILTQAVAIEAGADKIRVNCICPGAINTPMAHLGMPGGFEEAERLLARMQPIPEPGHPEDIAAAALFLASDEARFITGTALSVDGGLNTGNGWLGSPDQSSVDFRGPSYLR